MTKCNIIYSNKFKKNLKKLLKQGKELKKLDYVVNKLSQYEKLDAKYKNHPLYDDKRYKGCSECHIEPDWVLVYKYIDNNLVLVLVCTGSHSEVLD